MSILNPRLYQALQKRFGVIKVANEGEKYQSRRIRDPYDSERIKEECSYAGEYYQVCCPYCKDDRFRLWINHMWNTRDNNGRTTGRHLAICYNERCDISTLHKELLFFLHDVPTIGKVIATGSEAALFKPVALPGHCVPINTLPSEHPAIQYLMNGRLNPNGQPVRLDPNYLFERWRVYFCLKHENPLLTNRLILPVFRANVMVGWQARAIDNWSQPKYYTMPGLHKSRWLVNGDRARQLGIGVITEGFFDAFAVGECAVAALGKTLSPTQQRLLMSWFGNGIVCFLLDPDAKTEMLKYIELFRGCFRGGCFAAFLPDKWDAGACRQEDIWGFIRAEGQRQGIKVP